MYSTFTLNKVPNDKSIFLLQEIKMQCIQRYCPSCKQFNEYRLLCMCTFAEEQYFTLHTTKVYLETKRKSSLGHI
jgi:hypothetical protein